MTNKEYFQQALWLDRKINSYIREAERLREMTVSIRSPSLGDKVQTSPRGDAFAAAMAAIADRDIQRRELLYTYEELRDRIVGQIIAMPNPLQARVLYDRYVQNRTLVQIADETHYSYTRVCHVHGQALADFYRRYLQDDNI